MKAPKFLDTDVELVNPNFATIAGGAGLLGRLVGAAWLTYKTDTDVRDFGCRLLPWLLGAVLAFLAAAFAYALGMNLRVLHQWIARPAMLALPLVGLCACAGLVLAVRRRVDWAARRVPACLSCSGAPA